MSTVPSFLQVYQRTFGFPCRDGNQRGTVSAFCAGEFRKTTCSEIGSSCARRHSTTFFLLTAILCPILQQNLQCINCIKVFFFVFQRNFGLSRVKQCCTISACAPTNPTETIFSITEACCAPRALHIYDCYKLQVCNCKNNTNNLFT